MTLRHDGWLDGRPFRVVRDEAGIPQKLVCMRCHTEHADRDLFVAHRCEQPVRTRPPRRPTQPMEE